VVQLTQTFRTDQVELCKECDVTVLDVGILAGLCMSVRDAHVLLTLLLFF
jgi:hypothetical protein